MAKDALVRVASFLLPDIFDDEYEHNRIQSICSEVTNEDKVIVGIDKLRPEAIVLLSVAMMGFQPFDMTYEE